MFELNLNRGLAKSLERRRNFNYRRKSGICHKQLSAPSVRIMASGRFTRISSERWFVVRSDRKKNSHPLKVDKGKVEIL